MNDVCRAVRRVTLLPRGAAAYVLVRMSRRSRIDGFELVDASDAPSAAAAAKIGQALHLIAEVLPSVYARLQRDVRRVILLKAGGPEYWPFADAIALKAAVVERAEVPLLAMTLLHEATHARLWKTGIEYPSKDRDRIERLCVDAELRLARLLPDATELEEFAREKLARKWWTEDAQRARMERTRRELR